MKRITGNYIETRVGEETVSAFVPLPLPPQKPRLEIGEKIEKAHSDAVAALDRLRVAGAMVPNRDWYLYGFVRKEAVITSQIEGTQATLEDVLSYEVSENAKPSADAEEVCNYIAALEYARAELKRAKGLPICVRLLCGVHKRLMQGVRGADRQPGEIRRSQNWIGGTRPGNARFVPPPPNEVNDCLAAWERWIHSRDKLPPLIKAGLAHVQFETIHPFLDGNGRIGRLLIALLLEEWRILDDPLLYISVAVKRKQQEYYRVLANVRTKGDWEGWTVFFLNCVREAADDGVQTATGLFRRVSNDRDRVIRQKGATAAAFRLFESLPGNPMVTLSMAIRLAETTKPTAAKAIKALTHAGILKEITGKKRDRVYAYEAYLRVLA